MNWKNRLRRVEEDADVDGNGEENDDDDDDDDGDDDDDEDDDYNCEGVLNAGLAEFRVLRRNSAEYALDAKTTNKTERRWRAGK
ncbi:PREDICTED: PH domain-containing protein YHR131C-like [Atta colombica]|uniref:PH domain-containing protein YHR131C-like n=1 Tax=Atta colombica TaxID=520822 RepID=UPI00084BEBAC|nr:PREDICTED: PH domain-containing protein YHR131C-like [Atta colombica]